MKTGFRLLIVCVILIFLGRGYQYLFWGAPLRVLLWDEGLMSPIVEGLFGRDWTDYATDTGVSTTIGHWQRGIGLLWVVCAMATAAFLWVNQRWQRVLIAAGTGFLVFHALLDTKDHFYHLVQFFEYGIQVGAPLLLLRYAAGKLAEPRFLFWAKLAVALTFAAHGLYALGVYPVPGGFVDMTILILGVGENTARNFLTVAGILDLVVAVLIFVPSLARYGLWYATLWGLLTALARMVAGWQLDVAEQFIHQYAYQTTFRIPHGLFPFTIWWISRYNITPTYTTQV